MYAPQLKTFFAVAETGSFTKAASKLFLTPSAILHQVRALEKEFDAELFVRSAKGVTLTPAGEYLEKHGRELLRLDAEIHREIKAITRKEETVCIGTSMLEKCRLLYDLWVLFSAEEKGCGIEMVNINMGQGIPEKADLIESLNSGVPWMREWQFFEICKVPFGCAMVRDHPLAKKERISFEDLRDETVHSINDGSCETISELLARIRAMTRAQSRTAESMSRGVDVIYNDDGSISLDLHIGVDQGVNMSTVARSIKKEVSYKLSKSTGVPVKAVDVYIDTIIG